jgi:hypothetical protein
MYMQLKFNNPAAENGDREKYQAVFAEINIDVNSLIDGTAVREVGKAGTAHVKTSIKETGSRLTIALFQGIQCQRRNFAAISSG